MAKKQGKRDTSTLAVVREREQGPGQIVERRVISEVTFTDEQRTMIRNQYAQGSTDHEFAVLMAIAAAKRLNPITGQIHFVKRKQYDKDKQDYTEKWATQTGIDGFRAIADRTGLYDGQDEPEFVYETEKITDQGNGSEREVQWLVLARVRVYRKDVSRPFVGIAHFREYVQTKGKTGDPNHMWASKPHIMLAKCAEALAMRKAFPDDLGGLHIAEEFNDDTGGGLSAGRLDAGRPVIDAAITTAARKVEEDDIIGRFSKQLDEATTNDRLDDLGLEMSSTRMNQHERKVLADRYSARRKAVNPPPPPTDEQPAQGDA